MTPAPGPASADRYGVAVSRAHDYEPASVKRSLRDLAAALRWDDPVRGPLGGVIPAGARVVVKPNWVMHRNGGMWGTECLITQPSLIREVVELLLASGVGRVEVGDAPVQGCEFSEVVRGGDLAAWAKELAARDGRFAGLHDYRRTRSRLTGGVLVQAEDQISLSDFVLFDLGPDSLLEPVSSPKGGFRVTQYDPRKMAATHGPGRHQYLVARAVLEADVVLNLPKLKTHRKAGLTNALKNLVGVNGNKEFLPHHRVGGSAAGGDCYPGSSLVKVLHERLLDAQNLARSHAIRRALGIPVRLLSAAGRALVDTLGVEGAWSGNDTVWRMCLDLNRIVLYGRPDGTMADRVQRRILTISDAIVAGQGDGPLMPEPFPLGVLLAGDNPAAVDLVAAELLGFQPERVPLVRESFGRFRWPIAPLGRGSVVLRLPDGGAGLEGQGLSRPARYPEGWLDAVEPGGRAAPAGSPGRPANTPMAEA